MNPALPLLLVLSLGGLAAWRLGAGRWRELGLPWAVAGLAAMLLLAPALAIPDGVPSPGANLGRNVPWTGVEGLDPADGNPHLRDVAQQVQPWLLFARSELRAGRLPYWNPHQLAGTPFWSNGSSAPLFPFHLLFAALPVQLGLVVLPWLRLVVGGCGAFALARELGSSRRAALAAAVVFPLSGTITAFVLFPMGNAHALVPWVLLATERLASGGPGHRRWPILALVAGLQLMAGHPETAVFTGLLALVYLAVRGTAPGRGLAVWARFAGAWVVAGAISAVHNLPLALTLLRSSKWLATEAAEPVPLATAGSLLLRLVLPELHGNPALGTWWGPYNHPATAIYAGAATLPLVAAALGALRRDRRWLAVAALALVALLAAYQAPGLRHLLGTLPVLEKSLTHYLKLGLELGLALLAARGIDRLRAGEGRGALAAGAAAVLAAVGVAWLVFAGEWRAHGLVATEAAWTAGVAAVVLGLAAVAHLPAGVRRRAAGAVAVTLPAVLAVDLALANGPTNPALPAAKLYPATGAVRFLARVNAGGLDRVAGVGTALQPNAAMVHGLYDVRGDTPVKLQSYQEVYATFAAPDPVFYQPIRTWRSPWLDRLGTRWVVTRPGAPPPPGLRPRRWRRAYDGEDARIWERTGTLPLVRWRGRPAAGLARVSHKSPAATPEMPVDAALQQGDRETSGLEVLERSPGHWLVAWQSGAPGTVVVAEAWDPGWRATVDGRPAPVEAVDGVLLGVRAEAGSGHLSLSYRPRGLGWGLALTLAGVAVCAAGLARRRRS